MAPEENWCYQRNGVSNSGTGEGTRASLQLCDIGRVFAELVGKLHAPLSTKIQFLERLQGAAIK
jgi:hypothetical protein